MRSGTALVAAVVALAIAPRAYFAARYTENEFLVVDAAEYKDISANLARGDGYSISFYRWFEPVDPDVEPLRMQLERPELVARPESFRPPLAIRPDFHRPPLLPLLGAAVMRLPGGWAAWSRPTAVALGVGTVLMVFWVASLAFDRPTGLIAAALFGLYPYAVYYSAHWCTELLAAPLMLACVGLALRSRRPQSGALDLLLLGAVGGLAVMARPNLAAGVAAVIAWRGLTAGSRRLGLRSMALSGLALALTLVPWTVRNYAHQGVVQPLTFLAPFSMWAGMNEYSYDEYRARFSGRDDQRIAGESYREGYQRRVRSLEERGVTDVLEVNAFWMGETLDFVSSHPDRAAYVMAARLRNFWTPFPRRSRSSLEYGVGLISTGSLMLLSLLTLVLWRSGAVLALALPALASSLAFLPFFFALRYRFPVLDPYLAIVAARALSALAGRAQEVFASR